uniref:Uncharacterized protein n=1 Tax=Brassica oleracea var. oleracea TaxID=109376 RepID=A0A0D3D7A6_BRAOL
MPLGLRSVKRHPAKPNYRLRSSESDLGGENDDPCSPSPCNGLDFNGINASVEISVINRASAIDVKETVNDDMCVLISSFNYQCLHFGDMCGGWRVFPVCLGRRWCRTMYNGCLLPNS